MKTRCKKCNSGVMEQVNNGIAIATKPEKYVYRCKACGNEEWIARKPLLCKIGVIIPVELGRSIDADMSFWRGEDWRSKEAAL